MADKTYMFTLVLEPLTRDGDVFADCAFEAGCDDALVGMRAGVTYLDFDREAGSLEDAVISAIRQVESIQAKVSHVEPDDIVTASEIARRTELSREAIRLFIEGERGPGDFPAPVSGITSSSTRWRWVHVVRWLSEAGRLPDEEMVHAAEFISGLNKALRKRAGEITSTHYLELLKKLE